MSAFEILYEMIPSWPVELGNLVIDYLCFPRITKMIKCFDRQTEWETSLIPEPIGCRYYINKAVCSRNLIWVSTNGIVTVYNTHEKLAEFKAHGILIGGLHDDSVLEAENGHYVISRLRESEKSELVQNNPIEIVDEGDGRFDIYEFKMSSLFDFTIIAHASHNTISISRYQDKKLTYLSGEIINSYKLKKFIIISHDGLMRIMPCGTEQWDYFVVEKNGNLCTFSYASNNYELGQKTVIYGSQIANIESNKRLSLRDNNTNYLLFSIDNVDDCMLGDEGMIYCILNHGTYLRRHTGGVIQLSQYAHGPIIRVHNNIMKRYGDGFRSIDDEQQAKHCFIKGYPIGYIGNKIITRYDKLLMVWG